MSLSDTPLRKEASTHQAASARILGSGEMAQRIRSHSWADTPLGDIEQWPRELVCAVNMMISSKLICCLIWGTDRTLIYNDLYQPLLGNKPYSLGARFLDVWAEIRDQAEGIISEAWNTGEANLFEKVPFFILIDGELTERVCSLTNNPVWCETERGPRIGGLYQTIIDHTEGVLAERNLRESEARLQQSYAELQAIYDSGVVALALIDARTFCYRRANAKLAEMLDEPLENLIGSSVFQLASNLPELRSQLEQVAAGASLIGVTQQGELSNSPGEYRYWQSNFVPIRSSHEEITGIAAASVEMTHQKKAEAALIQNEKLAAVGRLAASIAHEINNPLESMTNLLYLARMTKEPDMIQGYLDTAERELRRVSVISNQTLRFYRQSTKAQIVSCQELFESVLSMYQGRIVNSLVKVEKKIRPTRFVQCFDGEIRQVLTNLIGNAIDALHPNGGRLLLRSREGTNWNTGSKGVVLTIADTGAGMPQEVCKKIFDAFYTTKGIGGTGLGLWVSKEIMDRHRGTVTVRSSQKADAGGTVFTLFLPFEAAIR